jgi:sugar phosphate isomerase/epimerase
MSKANIGLIGIVGEESKQDFWGTMERVARIGYRGIEAPGRALLEGDVKENLKRFHDLGLQVLTVSANKDRLRDSLPEIISEAKALQSPRVSMWWATCESREAVLQDAALYNAAGAVLAEEGITLCYHNHGHEFRRIYNGVYALDILAEHTDPKAVSFELDIAWITFGGEDPVTVLRRYAGRVPSIHVKDLVSTEEPAKFTTVGTGIVKIRESVQAAIDTGVEWIVVEQDHLRNLTAFETITVSYLNLKEAGLVA